MNQELNFYSHKGGSGVTVTAAAVAVQATREGMRVALVDHTGTGDVFTALGMAATDADRQMDLTVNPIAAGRLLVTDETDMDVSGYDLVVRDHGVVTHGIIPPGDGTRLLVLRGPCIMGLRRAREALGRPDGIVLVAEEHRALDAADVTATIGVPVTATIGVDAAVARAVDAGLLRLRQPKNLTHAASWIINEGMKV